MKKVLSLGFLLLIFQLVTLFSAPPALAQSCGGSGYVGVPDGVGTCESGFLGDQCSFGGGPGTTSSCGGAYCSRIAYYAGMYKFCENTSPTTCREYIANVWAAGYTTAGCTGGFPDPDDPPPPPPPPQYNVSAYAWLDTNQNCVRDGGYPIVQGQRITVTGPEDRELYTGSDGKATFVLLAGTYDVRARPTRDDYILSSCNNDQITGHSPQNGENLWFYFDKVHKVTANVRLDTDGDGDGDQDYRSGSNPARVNLQGHNGFDNVHTWEGLLNGDYQLDLGLPNGYILSGGSSQRTFRIEDTDPQSRTFTFTIRRDRYTVKGRVMWDTDGDGDADKEYTSDTNPAHLNLINEGIQQAPAQWDDLAPAPNYTLNFRRIPTGFVLVSGSPNRTFNINSGDPMSRTFTFLIRRIAPIAQYDVTSITYHDTNNNCVADEVTPPLISGIRFRTTGEENGSCVTDGTGRCTIGPLREGDYTLTLNSSTIPATYEMSSCNDTDRTFTLTGDRSQRFYLHPLPGIFSIRGSVRLNGAPFGGPPAPDIGYRLQPSGSVQTATVVNGTFNIPNLPEGRYHVWYRNKPALYTVTPAGTPPTHSVRIGATTCDPTTGGVCNAGSITGLNFDLTDAASSWFQSETFDMRFDNNFPGGSNKIPDAIHASCGGGQYASVDGSGGHPGVIITGNSNPDFGTGTASRLNWKVGGSTYPEDYNNSGLLKSSYSVLRNTIIASGTTIQELDDSACADYNNCNPSSAATGPYHADRTLTLRGPINIAGGKKIVILASGNVIINGDINVDPGSYFLVSANGNITVNSSVGLPAGSPACNADPLIAQVEGIYVSGSNFQILKNSSCPGTPDRMLVMGGTVVVNAGNTGGRLINNRDLCAANNNFPSFRVNERPDFILNSPSFLQSPSTIWQEVAP